MTRKEFHRQLAFICIDRLILDQKKIVTTSFQVLKICTSVIIIKPANCNGCCVTMNKYCENQNQWKFTVVKKYCLIYQGKFHCTWKLLRRRHFFCIFHKPSKLGNKHRILIGFCNPWFCCLVVLCFWIYY